MAHRFTIGVEEEFQIVDPSSDELRSHVSELIAAASPGMGEQIKPELHQSIVEMGTRICENVEELRGELLRTRGELVAAAERVGLQVAVGTHPSLLLIYSGHCCQTLSALRPEHRFPPLPPRADRGEQVARGALGHRGEID